MVTRRGAYDPGVKVPATRVTAAGGFTLIELCYVVTVITVLTAVTVPVYDVLLRRARAHEAHAVLHDVAHAQLRHHRDRGTYVDCPVADPVPDPTGRFPVGRACWKELGVIVEGEVRFRYGTETSDEGFTVIGEGDLDGDGETSRFVLDGRTMVITTDRELE